MTNCDDVQAALNCVQAVVGLNLACLKQAPKSDG